MDETKTPAAQQAPESVTADVIKGRLDLSHVGVTKNDIISGRVQKAVVDGSKHETRAALGCDDGGFFEVVTATQEKGEPVAVKCVLAQIIETNHAMKSTVMGNSSVDASGDAEQLSVVMFRRA